MSACIYCIKNKVNGHCYIGQTINFTQRKSKHFRELENNKHHNILLQRAYNKYGKENFEMYILEDNIPLDKLGDREDALIDEYGYYNIAGGRRAFTPTALRNMSESHIGNKAPNRKISMKEGLYILAINDFCDGVIRAIASLSNNSFTRETPKNLIKRRGYKEISSFYDTLPFSKKLLLFSFAIKYYNYNPWKPTNCLCPKKRAYIKYILEHTTCTDKAEIAEMVQLSRSALNILIKQQEESPEKISTIYNDSEIKQILEVILEEQYRAKLI